MKMYFFICLYMVIFTTSCRYESIKGPSGTKLSGIAAVLEMNIFWEPKLKQVYLVNQDVTYIFKVGEKIVYLDGQPLQMSSPAVQHDGEVYIPSDFSLSRPLLFPSPNAPFAPNVETYIAPQEHEIYDILLDPGHGGKDPGAIRENIVEKELNLELAQIIAQKLSRDYSVSFTRETDIYLSLEERILKTKRAKIVVSIHFNASGSEKANGYEIWVSFKNLEKSQLLANKIEEQMSILPLTNRGIRYNDFQILSQSQIPAVLIECGFISSKSDMQWFQKKENCQQISELIALGIKNFLESEKK